MPPKNEKREREVINVDAAEVVAASTKAPTATSSTKKEGAKMTLTPAERKAVLNGTYQTSVEKKLAAGSLGISLRDLILYDKYDRKAPYEPRDPQLVQHYKELKAAKEAALGDDYDPDEDDDEDWEDEEISDYAWSDLDEEEEEEEKA